MWNCKCGAHEGWGCEPLGAYNRRGWEIREGFPEEAMVDSHLEDPWELTRCRMGLRQETKVEAFQQRRHTCTEALWWEGEWQTLRSHTCPSPAPFDLKKKTEISTLTSSPAWSSPWLPHLPPILVHLSRFYLPARPNSTPNPSVGLLIGKRKESHLWGI